MPWGGVEETEGGEKKVLWGGDDGGEGGRHRLEGSTKNIYRKEGPPQQARPWL
jgi:hypothetical protein